MSEERLDRALSMIDQANGEDPERENWQGQDYPRALLYGLRMSAWLEKLTPEPNDAQRIAARAQHIRRWTVPRDSYPATREGYLQWRSFLYRFHAEQAAAIAHENGYPESVVAAVKKMVGKQGIKQDAEVQLIEDVACLVFLEHYFPDFAEGYDEEKLIGIVRKTWRKMSDQARQAALQLSLPETLTGVVGKALEETAQ
ncbi:DUF4202 domain-containing protein [Methylococcus sp. EFPC2]|uniref:DUF4202 domain-containing protein n=1 Tax=Methylococcus sp. EFPC2 TaxID=2812648 RepID=UPI0019682E70|nr:DUF4202 domain-containing protein [Methylococcus sp. EFPC2]QSA95510.1 DUF4202 domain-containing protein [Methylococcus sp. EFPC2]